MSSPAEPIRVLHVEDDPEFADLSATFLEREDERLTVETALGADEGQAVLCESHVDCVISDYDMPGRDGIEFLEAVREDYPDLPFVLFTGKGSEDVAADAISAGVTDYLQKETGSEQYAILANRIANAVERYRIERGARQARTQLTAISEHSTDAILIIDEDSRIEYANAAVADHFGYAPDELEGESLLTLVPERYHDRHLAAVERYLETGERSVNWSNVEFPARRNDGTEIQLSVSFSEFEQAGESRFIGIMRDTSEGTQIEAERTQMEAERTQMEDERTQMEAERTQIEAERTQMEDERAQMEDERTEMEDERTEMEDERTEMEDERTEMEAELRERDERFEQLAEHIQDVVWMTDPEKDRLLYVSPAYEDIWGRSVESLYENPTQFLEAVHPADRDRIVAAVENQAEGGFDEEYRVQQPDGDVRWVRDRAIPVTDEAGEVYRIVGIATDITERKRREAKLEDEKAFVDQSLDALQDAFFVLGTDGDLIRWNEKVRELTGYADDELVSMDPEAFFITDHRDRVLETIQEILETGSAKVQADIRSKHGERIPHEFIGTRLEDTDGNLLGVAGVGRDISGRQRRERELIRTRDLLEQTERIADVGGWELDLETDEVFWTDHLFDIMGVEGDEAPPLPDVLEFYHEEDRPTVDDAVRRALSTGEPFEVEVRIDRDDGERRWLRIFGTPIREEERVLKLRGAVQDITDQKEYERQLERQNERLEQFASFVSHDLRNPLNVAELRLEQVREECSSEYLDDIEDAHDRMNGLIAALLSLAREGETATNDTTIDLGELAVACWGSVDTKDATLETDVTGTIRADETRLRQVIENLVRNAVEHGGEDATLRIGELDEGFYVEDDGPGIPAEERDAVFEMGHSTTEGGTGFGLSIVREIVDAHDWQIRVTEGAAGGARFEITGVEFVDD